MSTFSSTTTVVDNGKLVTSTYTGANSVATSTVTVQSNTIALTGNTTENANAFLQAVLEIPVVSLPSNMVTVTNNNNTLSVGNFYNININDASPKINLPNPVNIGTFIVIFNNSPSTLKIPRNDGGYFSVNSGKIKVYTVLVMGEMFWGEVLG